MGIRASGRQPNMVREDHAVTSPQVRVICCWRCCASIRRDHNSTAISNPALAPRSRKYYPAAQSKPLTSCGRRRAAGRGASSIERQATEGLSRAITFRGNHALGRAPTCRLNVAAEGQIRSMEQRLQSIASSSTEPEREPIPGFGPSHDDNNEDAEPDDDSDGDDEDEDE